MQADGWSCLAFTAGSKKQYEPPSPAFSNLTNRAERPRPKEQSNISNSATAESAGPRAAKSPPTAKCGSHSTSFSNTFQPVAQRLRQGTQALTGFSGTGGRVTSRLRFPTQYDTSGPFHALFSSTTFSHSTMRPPNSTPWGELPRTWG